LNLPNIFNTASRLSAFTSAPVIFNISVLVFGKAAIYVRIANLEEVRPEAADEVLGDVRGELRAGGAEGERAHELVHRHDPRRDGAPQQGQRRLPRRRPADEDFANQNLQQGHVEIYCWRSVALGDRKGEYSLTGSR